MERKTRLKSWLHQMLQRAQEGERLPLPEELAIFYKEDEIAIEKLEEMLKDFSCNMSPANTPPVATYRRRNRGRGKGRRRGKKLAPSLGEKPGLPDLSKTIIFRGEESQPIPEVEVRVNSFVFDPSDEEEEEQEEIISELPCQKAARPADRAAQSKSGQDESLAPEEGLLTPLFEEESNEQPEARRTNQFRQPIKPLADIVPPLEQLHVRADRKIIQHMKRFPTNVTIWDAIAWSKELRASSRYNQLVGHMGIHGHRSLTEALNKDSLVRQKEYPTESLSKSRESVYIETSARHSRGILEQWSVGNNI
ncbi:hypothetical protein Taro_045699 [Colocasia esculenta]|uniref:Uncharacterized protein n=1 Tax=Colocasia esculenta TaxID=4460 RepID=A0A843X6R7_COLES|nr:hypothetical protein [Colocasia esculenta]